MKQKSEVRIQIDTDLKCRLAERAERQGFNSLTQYLITKLQVIDEFDKDNDLEENLIEKHKFILDNLLTQSNKLVECFNGNTEQTVKAISSLNERVAAIDETIRENIF